ncbi:hypothetical protein MHYP_G00132320 [Metynnis hypsauchen]
MSKDSEPQAKPPPRLIFSTLGEPLEPQELQRKRQSNRAARSRRHKTCPAAGLREQVELRQRGLRVPLLAQAIFLNYAGVSAERRPEEARRMHAYLPDTVCDSHSCDQLSATPAAFDARCPGKLWP